MIPLVWALVWLAAAVALPGLNRSGGLGGWAAMSAGVLAGQDTLSHDYPAAMWGWGEMCRSGRIPLWNPSWFCGQPFVASQTFMAFYPPNWLSLVLPFPLAFNIQYPLHLWLAAAAMAWAVRRRRMGWWAAGLAGLAWGFGGHVATLTGPGHLQKVQALVWLPIVVWGFAEILAGRFRRAAAPWAAALAMQVLAGHLQIVYLSLMAGGLEGAARWSYAGYQAFSKEKHQAAQRVFTTRRALAMSGALALAMALSAVFWIPTVEFAGQSNRQGAISYEDAARGSIPPEEAMEWALPRLLGDSMTYSRFPYRGRFGESATSSAERIISDYAGAAAILLALAGLLGGRGRLRRRALSFWGLAAMALWLSLGRYSGGLHWLAWRFLPGFSHFRSPATTMALVSYGLSMAAACGAASSAGLRRHLTKNTIIFAGLLATLTVACLIYGLGYTKGDEDALSGAPLALSITRLLGVMGFSMLLLTLFRGRRRGVGLALLTLVLAVDLLENDRAFWVSVDARPYSQYLTKHPALAIWGRAPQPVRHLQAGNELSNRALTLSDFDRNRTIATTEGYHPVAYRRYYTLLEGLGGYSPAFLRLMGVGFLILPQGMNAPANFQPVGPLGGGQLWTAPDHPYARRLTSLTLAPNPATMLEGLRAPSTDARAQAWIAPGAARDAGLLRPGAPEAGPLLQFPPAPCATAVTIPDPGQRLVDVQTGAPGLIVMAEPAVSGWRAWVNDVPATIIQVDGLLPAVAVPAGSSRIRLAYDPWSQRLGLFLTCWGLGALGWLAGHRVRLTLRRTG